MISGSFRPGLLLSVLTAVALVVLIGLGTWQAQRIAPKKQLINSIEVGLAAAPSPLPVHLDDPATVAYRRFSFDGTASAEAPVRVFGTNLKGSAGYHLYKPVVREFGRAVIVNFGWVPFELETMPPLPSGPVSLQGVLMENPVAGSFTIENDSENGNWYFADVHEIAVHYGLNSKDYYHFRFFADHSGEPRALPRGSQVRVDIPNNHFQYMLTWFGIAAALIGVYIAFGYKRAKENIPEDTPEKP